MQVIAQQADGHLEVILKSASDPRSDVVASVPNGQLMLLLIDNGCDYVKVRWRDQEGYARRTNVVEAPGGAQGAATPQGYGAMAAIPVAVATPVIAPKVAVSPPLSIAEVCMPSAACHQQS